MEISHPLTGGARDKLPFLVPSVWWRLRRRSAGTVSENGLWRSHPNEPGESFIADIAEIARISAAMMMKLSKGDMLERREESDLRRPQHERLWVRQSYAHRSVESTKRVARILDLAVDCLRMQRTVTKAQNLRYRQPERLAYGTQLEGRG